MSTRLNEATVINLWVVFERFLIEDVTAGLSAHEHLSEGFADRLTMKVAQEIERWRFDELLDLYKGSVDSAKIGAAKQVKSYRDWVAHQNPRKPPAMRIHPETAYELLVAIVHSVAADRPGSESPES